MAPNAPVGGELAGLKARALKLIQRVIPVSILALVWLASWGPHAPSKSRSGRRAGTPRFYGYFMGQSISGIDLSPRTLNTISALGASLGIGIYAPDPGTSNRAIVVEQQAPEPPDLTITRRAPSIVSRPRLRVRRQNTGQPSR